MSIERRIEKLEEQYGGEKGCTIVEVVWLHKSINEREAGIEPAGPSDGAAERYIEENNLCENCTRKGLCILYWNGETFVQSSSSMKDKLKHLEHDVTWVIGKGYE